MRILLDSQGVRLTDRGPKNGPRAGRRVRPPSPERLERKRKGIKPWTPIILGAIQMRKTMTLGATLVLALTAAAGRDIEATHSSADVVLEWNQLLQRHPSPRRAIR